ncbi:MAG: hypothetical protein PHO37_09520 [Kiritimatiellae bacterium]|nr:hypothetical protein [Kiritimatiellia bacterium]
MNSRISLLGSSTKGRLIIKERLLPLLIVGTAYLLHATDLVWFDGSVTADAPSGKLLSDNEGYWGEVVLTGVEYWYESDPANPADRIANQPESFGRRLLDGRTAGDWHVPVGQSRGPLVVVFDFKRPCTFTEVNTICTRTPDVSVRIEVADSPAGEWRMISDRPSQDGEKQTLRRLKLPPDSRGRYLRLSISSTGITYVDELLVWGSGEVSDEYPENIAPTYLTNPLKQGMLVSIPGVTATQFPVAKLIAWRAAIGHHAEEPAVWAQSVEASPTAPVLPPAAAINAPLHMLLTRNESESAFVTLSNTSATESLSVTMNEVVLHHAGLSEVAPKLKASLLIGGALPATPPKQRLTAEQRLRLMADDTLPSESQSDSAVCILPFFGQGQMLGRSLMQRYLSNGTAIRDFPHVVLPVGGAAVFLLRITTDQALPGRYTGVISATAADGRRISMPLTVEVIDLVLPELGLWVRSWGNGTRQFPFESRSRIKSDARVNRELGVTVWAGLPMPGSKAAAFGAHGRTHYQVTGIPDDFVNRGYCNLLTPEQLNPKDESRIANHVKELVRQARELNLSYDEWWVELWDEPQETNAALFGALARIIRRTDPSVRIYMNPLFWRPGHTPQEDIVKHLGAWYNENIDISVPITTLVGDNLTTRELWGKPRFVRAFFIHPARRGGRAMAWKAFDLGFNGWGYYCYYAPRGNPWDIRT